MAIDVLKLFAGRPMAIERGRLEGLIERAALQLGGARDLHQAKERYAAAAIRNTRPFAKTPTGDVAVVKLSGVIDPDPFMAWLFGGTSPDELLQNLREAASAASVVVMVIDSPGGSVELVPETAAAIRAIGAKTPIIAVARCMAASAAYYLASACNEIIASPSSQLGSIGVLSVHYDQSGLNERIGIKPSYIYAGEFKVEVNPNAPMSADATAYQQQQIDEIYRTFVADVARGRKVTTAKVRSDFGKGRMMDAAAAVRAGLADGVDTLEGVISHAGGRRSRLLGMSQVVQAAADRDSLDLALALCARNRPQ